MPSSLYAFYWACVFLPLAFLAVELSAALRGAYWNTLSGWAAWAFDVWKPWAVFDGHHVAVNWRRLSLAAFMFSLTIHLVWHVDASHMLIPTALPLAAVVASSIVGEVRAWKKGEVS